MDRVACVCVCVCVCVGEINTLRGNSNWMLSREGVMSCSALGLPKDVQAALSPVVPVGSSDTGSFDSVLELLTNTGREIPEVRAPMHIAWLSRLVRGCVAIRRLYTVTGGRLHAAQGPSCAQWCQKGRSTDVCTLLTCVCACLCVCVVHRS